MNKIKNFIVNADLAKMLKKLVICGFCVVILGGGLSSILLHTQIGEAVTYIQQEESYDKENDAQNQVEEYRGENKKHHEKDRAELENVISKPSLAAKIVVGITAVLVCLAAAVYWLLVAAWLYKAALNSKMHALLWSLFALAATIAAVVVFLLVRSFIRKKCDDCGSYQSVKAQYCTDCGALLTSRCSQCGSVGAKDDKFCHNCGKSLKNE